MLDRKCCAVCETPDCLVEINLGASGYISICLFDLRDNLFPQVKDVMKAQFPGYLSCENFIR